MLLPDIRTPQPDRSALLNSRRSLAWLQRGERNTSLSLSSSEKETKKKRATPTAAAEASTRARRRPGRPFSRGRRGIIASSVRLAVRAIKEMSGRCTDKLQRVAGPASRPAPLLFPSRTCLIRLPEQPTEYWLPAERDCVVSPRAWESMPPRDRRCAWTVACARHGDQAAPRSNSAHLTQKLLSRISIQAQFTC